GDDTLESLPDSVLSAEPFSRLKPIVELCPFDMAVLVISIAPEYDLGYERLYAYLQDDVTRKRPSVDLALNLLCNSAQAKLERRTHFAPDAPLMRNDLLHLIPDPQQTQPPLLAHFLKLDDQIVGVLLGQTSLDRRLASFCWLGRPDSTVGSALTPEITKALPALVRQAREVRHPLALYVHVARGSRRHGLAEALVGVIDTPVVAVDLARLESGKARYRIVLDADF